MDLFFNLDYIMYGVLLVIVILVSYIESRDWKCENSYDITQPCKQNDGMPYRGSKPDDEDSSEILLRKINKASEAEQNSIKWRRSVVMAITITFLIYVLVITPSSLPKWTEFYLVSIIAAAVMYYNFNYYSYHNYKKPQEYIEKCTTLLGERIK